ncbi:MAG: hypothetical protein KA974_06000 [Saprospiraceae bacterium]|nr:hypothetical protein [Saprospiraceae bacterium]MBP7699552.1 hypothetical protein [Saprospiraceae bacterium]
MSNITLQYPAWYVLLCIALGLIGAGILYYKQNDFKEQHAWFRRVLAALRFLSFTLISLFLLSPLIKSVKTETKKPVVVIAQDVSESVLTSIKDTAAYKKELTNLREELSEDYDVTEYSFGASVREGIRLKSQDKESNIAEMLQYIYDIYSNQNLGAVVLATDGIYNKGSNPLYATEQLKAPIFSIALGDTSIKKDILLKRVFHNNIAYLGDKFTIQADIAAGNSAGSNSTLTVAKVAGDQVRNLDQQVISINKNEFFTTKEIVLNADQAGVQHYRLSLSKINGEVSTVNNVKDIFIDVLDARQKILLFANAPHPDIAAFKQVIETNKNYQVTVAYARDGNVQAANFDFVIFHQLPSRNVDIASTIAMLNDRKTPRLFVIGLQTDLAKLNQYQDLITISARTQSGNDVQAVVDGNFNLFTIDDRLLRDLPNFNPVSAPFGDYKLSGNTQTLLYQKVGKIATKYPLLSFGDTKGIRTGIFAAEGIWKWRLFDFLQHQNHEITSELIEKSIQYLSVKDDKRRFRTITAKHIFGENEPILIDAELYNASYELINEPEASITITNSAKKDFTYTFNKNNKSYSLNAGILPVGSYTFKAIVNVSGETLVSTGKFNVQPIQLELFETTANFNLLRSMSEQTSGKMVTINDLAQLLKQIQQKDTIKPVIYSSHSTDSIINYRWLFGLLLLLLATEWFLRKYFGSY